MATDEAVTEHHRKATYWYRADGVNYNPTTADMREHDAIEKWILHGWLPDRPFIDKDTRITAFGSCFAENITKYLNDLNYNLPSKEENSAYVVSMSEQLVNTFAILQQFQWAFENKTPPHEVWFGKKAQAFEVNEGIRQSTLDLFLKTDVFILTFGLSEIWYDEPTGAVFWSAVPENLIDPSRHKFRVATMAENRDNIRAIYDLIKKHRPDAKIIFTLSPIPLIATFRPVSSITANSVSKALLRGAIDEVYRDVQHEGRLFYWPSYEIVTEGFGSNPKGGRFNGDRRHVKSQMLDYIMRLFETYYCEGAAPRVSLLDAYVEARIATDDLSGMWANIVERKDRYDADRLIRSYKRSGDDATARLAELYFAQYWPAAERTAAQTEEAPAAPLASEAKPKRRLFGLSF